MVQRKKSFVLPKLLLATNGNIYVFFSDMTVTFVIA